MAQRDTPFDDPKARFQAGLFGMWLFLVVLAVVFASTILAYLVVRIDNGAAFIPENAPRPPVLLLASTVALVLSSFTMQRALRAGRTGDPRQGGLMLVTLILALAFLAVQVWAWIELWRAQLRLADSLYAWTFYVLTGLHAAHVVGGLVPLAVVWRRAAAGRYSAAHPEGAVYCAMYWHFLDAAWLALYATLWLGSLSGAAG